MSDCLAERSETTGNCGLWAVQVLEEAIAAKSALDAVLEESDFRIDDLY